MKELQLSEKMTLRQVADILGKDESTIRKIGKELFPDAFQNGKTTYLTEIHVTAIKLNLGKNSDLPKTKLEKALLIQQAMKFQQEIIEEQQAEIEMLTPKAIAFDSFMSAENSISVSETAKMFNVGPYKLFRMLRDAKIFKSNNVPYQDYMHHFDVIAKPVKIGDKIENKPVTLVKPSGVDFIMKKFNLKKAS